MRASFEPTGYIVEVAAKLRAEPDRIIAAALATLAHWRVRGQTAPHYLERWEELLREAGRGDAGAAEKLLRVLEGTDEERARMRDFHPFPGILTREERRASRGSCAYKH